MARRCVRCPDAVRACRAGFAGRFRRRKLVRQLACVAPPANTSPARPLRVPDPLLSGAPRTPSSGSTPTIAAPSPSHLDMRPPKASREGPLCDTY
ncbi:hypothetical protein DIPPA_19909 [Diplonema papillatum]|nr:hypothetical protein DIPPA_19909 [Diplonema papillatum]